MWQLELLWSFQMMAINPREPGRRRLHFLQNKLKLRAVNSIDKMHITVYWNILLFIKFSVITLTNRYLRKAIVILLCHNKRPGWSPNYHSNSTRLQQIEPVTSQTRNFWIQIPKRLVEIFHDFSARKCAGRLGINLEITKSEAFKCLIRTAEWRREKNN